ncbi:MAG: rhodanese-like domain-containing protein [Solirubrobacterales bacterium]
MEQLSPQEAQRLIDEEGARLVDCREDYEWDEMRIPGAQLVPLSEYQADPESLEEAPLTIFQCATGNRSETAAALYEGVYPQAKAYNLEGGIAAWAARGLPTDFGPA